MKRRIVTMEQLRIENPEQHRRVLNTLNRNRVVKRSPKIDFSKDSLEKYILTNILKN